MNTRQTNLANTLTELAQLLDQADAEVKGRKPRTAQLAKVGALAARMTEPGERTAAFARLREAIAG